MATAAGGAAAMGRYGPRPGPGAAPFGALYFTGVVPVRYPAFNGAATDGSSLFTGAAPSISKIAAHGE
ncbi:hypothetical protein ACP70R_013335 [Stipagrostis hirtigluma subsp. patula]